MNLHRRARRVAGSAAVLAACTDSKPQFKAVDLTGADYAKDFQLPDTEGRLRTLAEFRGKVAVVFFGYTL